MTRRRVRLTAPGADTRRLISTLAAIRAELQIPDAFPAEVLAEANRALSQPDEPRSDRTEVPLVTLDPPGSMDLDQALHLEREASGPGGGFLVWYAIADVGSFLRAGGPMDAESRRRGQSLYPPDGRIPLHPPQLSEQAASLLPDGARRAYLWRLRLDGEGELVDIAVERALVRSRARLDYAGAQRDLAAGRATPVLELLAEVGRLRMDREADRGGASLPKPDQEVYLAEGAYRLRFRPPVPMEEYNAQISLLTGMAAARLMLSAGVGLLRTMPAPDPDAVTAFRRQAAALGVDWPAEQTYGRFLRALQRSDPHHLALMHQATGLFRGAAYCAFDGGPPARAEHAALAAPYAHATAPLRRLADRFVLVTCEAIAQGRSVPDWVRASLPQLPELMATSDHRANALERACTDAVEAAVLEPLVGRDLPAMVVESRGRKGLVVQITEPAVLASCEGTAAAGQLIRARVLSADPTTRRVRLQQLPG